MIVVYAQLKKCTSLYAIDFKSLSFFLTDSLTHSLTHSFYIIQFCITISKAKWSLKKSKWEKKFDTSWKSTTPNFWHCQKCRAYFGETEIEKKEYKKFLYIYEHNTRKINTKMSLNFLLDVLDSPESLICRYFLIFADKAWWRKNCLNFH